jgi:hypothetical protein
LPHGAPEGVAVCIPKAKQATGSDAVWGCRCVPAIKGQLKMWRGQGLTSGLLLVLWSAAAMAQTSGAGGFDGSWGVYMACPRTTDAAPYFKQFAASVKGGVMHGEFGVAGKSASMALDGTIRPDGSATLDAHGLTGPTQYNIRQAPEGMPFHNVVTAHFEGARGTGTWVTTRTCSFIFTRQ